MDLLPWLCTVSRSRGIADYAAPPKLRGCEHSLNSMCATAASRAR
jgi:hypothetical protein